MRKGKILRTLKSKLTLAILACFFFVSIPSFFIIFSYMNSLVFAQRARVNRQWVEAAAEDVNDSLSSVIDAVSWGCFNENVVSSMKLSSPLSSSQTLSILDTQKITAAYMTASPAWDDLNKIIFFNEEGVFFEYTKNRYGALEDYELLIERKENSDIKFSPGSYVGLSIGTTLNSPYEDALLAYGRMDSVDAYIYAELDMSIFDPLLSDASVDNIYLRNVETGKTYPHAISSEMLDQSRYLEESFSTLIPGVEVVYFENRNPMTVSSVYGLSMFIILIAGSTLLVLIVSSLISRYLTRSTSRLVHYMRNLVETENYGSVDPTIEEGDDEIANIGKSVNSMSLSIAHLLESNERLYDEKKETELSMLQMQVNPHFLYNTLETIHYLAQLQKAEGIASMSRGLSHLLKNIAKGNGERIVLRDEIALVKEYDEIQQVRYMGMYEIVYDIPDELYECKIQKFTLQPLVENAIFHGIEPGGKCGTITISAHRDDTFLYIDVLDDGVGMSDEELSHVFDEKAHFKGNMTGVGIRNIRERIKLYYGDECDLTYESVKGKYTKAVVRIFLEKEESSV